MTIRLIEFGGILAMREALTIPFSLPPSTPEDTPRRARMLAQRGDDHAKALRLAKVYLAITAPRYWWAEFMTYRAGVEVVSESTMHTILKRNLSNEDFAAPLPKGQLNRLNSFIKRGDLLALKKELPEGFIQTRIVELNFQSLRRIYFARRGHRLPEWRSFLEKVRALPIPYLDGAVFSEREEEI